MDKELGRLGLEYYAGNITEEFLPELSGRRAIQVYKEMSENDATCGAILYAIKMLCRQASWGVRPASSDEADIEAARFVESCLYDMQTTWTETVGEILSFLTFGFSVHEICYKRRMGRQRDLLLESKYDDGLIGWQKLPIRAQESLFEWATKLFIKI